MNNERLLNCPEINVNENTMNLTQILNESNNKNLKCLIQILLYIF